MKSKVTYGVWLDIRYKLKNDKYPAKIRITHQRQTKYFPILESKVSPWEFSIDEWEIISKGKPRGTLRNAQLEKNAIEVNLRSIINSITNFTFDKFNDNLIGKKLNIENTTLKSCLTDRIAKYKLEGRISTSDNASVILNSFMKFRDGKDIELSELSVKTLQDYEDWMLKKGKSPATIGIYTRELRVMYNELIAAGILNRDCYPFGEGKYQPPKGKKVKSAIYKNEILQIVNYMANELNREAYCRDLWLFSYLCSGMNLKDIAHLKYGNINGKFIHFIREKTNRSNRTERIIPVPITEMARGIIKKWGNSSHSKGNYIFPILDGSESPEDIRRKVSNTNGLITDTIKRIAKILKLNNQKISANSARDAFATISLMQGRPISDISESLGHSNISVTQHYLAGFSDDDKIEWQNKLI